MTSFVSHTTIDCRNAYELSEWWKQVLGYVDLDDDPNAPGHEECLILSPDSGHRLLFIEVPDEKQVKNRIHLDIQPRSGTRDDEVARVVSLGAAEIDDQRNRYGPGIGWVVLQDPEGNEFCILRSDEERAANPMRPPG
jgi:Glyoxalase-like domain